MYRPTSSARILRQTATTARSNFKPSTRRFLTTEPPHKTSRSWKNSATRWTIAIAGIYWYNTTPLFAEQPQYTAQTTEPDLPTLDSLSRSKRFALPSEQDLPTLPVQPNTNSPPSLDPKSPLPSSTSPSQQAPASPAETDVQSPQDLEDTAANQGAFNEETGEINWDCPCLGGMAHGTCGPEFREAFSCFVFSKEEPKGMDCVDKFRGMQTCFREHPEEYGDQLDDDDEYQDGEGGQLGEVGEGVGTGAGKGGDGVTDAVGAGVAKAVEEEVKNDAAAGGIGEDAKKSPAAQEAKPARKSIYDSEDSKATTSTKEPEAITHQATNATKQSTTGSSQTEKGIAGDEGGDLLPKASHDAR